MKFNLPPKTNPLRSDISLGFLLLLEESEIIENIPTIKLAFNVAMSDFKNNQFAFNLMTYAKNDKNELVLLKISRLNDMEILWNFGKLL